MVVYIFYGSYVTTPVFNFPYQRVFCQFQHFIFIIGSYWMMLPDNCVIGHQKLILIICHAVSSDSAAGDSLNDQAVWRQFQYRIL